MAAALDLADAEGLDAVSMRRLAGELGVGAMSLYSHVAGKDELLELMADRIFAEFLAPELPADWREALRTIARRTRTAMLHHPWLVPALVAGAPEPRRLGPSALRHFEQSLAALTPLRLTGTDMIEVIQAVDSLVMGAVLDELDEWRGEHESEPDALGRSDELLRTGEFPLLVENLDARAARRDPETRFERSLDWLLAGIAADLER